MIKEIFKFFVDDIKSDIKFLNDVSTGKYKLKYNKEQLKELLDVPGMIKENWMLFLLVTFAFVCGFFYASQHYQDKCNLFIQDNILPECNRLNKLVNNQEYNVSNLFVGVATTGDDQSPVAAQLGIS